MVDANENHALDSSEPLLFAVVIVVAQRIEAIVKFVIGSDKSTELGGGGLAQT